MQLSIQMSSLAQATYMQQGIYPRLDAGGEQPSHELHVSRAGKSLFDT